MVPFGSIPIFKRNSVQFSVKCANFEDRVEFKFGGTTTYLFLHNEPIFKNFKYFVELLLECSVGRISLYAMFH